MNKLVLARRAFTVARGLRRITRNPVTLDEALRTVRDEVARREERFLAMLDQLVWPYPSSPVHRLLTVAGLEPMDVRRMTADLGLVGALERLRDLGVYVAYEEFQGTRVARRGSTSLELGPRDFFNPVTSADYLGTTGGSRSAGTPVELSFAWQRRQGAQRAIQYRMAGVSGAPTAVWLPVFPSAAGFGAVMKNAAGGNTPERWFSQVPTDLAGVAEHKQVANRALPVLNALAHTGLPAPEHVPTADPSPVVGWLRDALERTGRAVVVGYASSITAAARWAAERDIRLDGVVAFPASEPVTVGKLRAMRDAGMRPHPMYAFVPEGTVGISCPRCDDEEYHVWDQDLAVVERRRRRTDGTDVDAFCWTSLALESPRVLVNVENDDFGRLRHEVGCDCTLGSLGLGTRVADVRGISKVVAAGISLDGVAFDHLCEDVLPARFGGGPGDYQFVEDDTAGATVIQLRIRPDVGPVDDTDVLGTVRSSLEADELGVLASSVWGDDGHVRVVRADPVVSRAGKQLAYERLTTPATASPVPH